MEYIYCTDSVLDLETEFVVAITTRLCQKYAEVQSRQTGKVATNAADTGAQTKTEARQRINKSAADDKK